MEDFKGIYPAIVTPTTEAGTLDEPVIQKLIDCQLDAGVDGFYVGGTTGEGILHDTLTRQALARRVVEQTRGRGNVFVHVAACAVDDAVTLARHAASIGADAVSAVPPIFYRVDFQGLYDYYRRIAETSDLPLIIYHIPALSGLNLTLDELGKLFEIPNVQGIKFSDTNLFLLQGIQEYYPEISIFSGNDEIFLAALSMGAHGSIGLTLNIMPALYVEILKAFSSGDIKTAQDLQYKANRVIKIVVEYGMGGVVALKPILKMIGFDCGLPRRPITQLDRPAIDRIHRQLTEIDFFSDPIYTKWAKVSVC